MKRRGFLERGISMALIGGFGLASSEAVERKPKGRIKQGFAWWGFARDVDPKKLIAEAKAIGYVAVDMPPRDQWDRIRETGLVISSIGGHGSLTDGLNNKANHDRIEQELRRNIETAVQYGIPCLICFSGNRRGISDEEGIENTAEGLRRVAKFAEEKKVTLVLELLNSKVDHPDYQCDHTWWGVEVVKRVNSPAVKLLYDIYHMQIMEGDLIRTIRNNIKYIGHFHTGGNPGRRDLDDQQEIYYPAVMRAIADSGFDGYVCHEFIPKGDPIKALRAAFETCDV
jgi:hydroxypyruvate isomerase